MSVNHKRMSFCRVRIAPPTSPTAASRRAGAGTTSRPCAPTAEWMGKSASMPSAPGES